MLLSEGGILIVVLFTTAVCELSVSYKRWGVGKMEFLDIAKGVWEFEAMMLGRTAS